MSALPSPTTSHFPQVHLLEHRCGSSPSPYPLVKQIDPSCEGPTSARRFFSKTGRNPSDLSRVLFLTFSLLCCAFCMLCLCSSVMTMNVTMLFHFQWDELAERNTFKTLAVRFDRIYEHSESCNLYKLPRWVDLLVYLSLHLLFLFVACLVSIKNFCPALCFCCPSTFFLPLSLLPVYVLISLFMSLLPVYVLISLFMSLLPVSVFSLPLYFFVAGLRCSLSLSLSLSNTDPGPPELRSDDRSVPCGWSENPQVSDV